MLRMDTAMPGLGEGAKEELQEINEACADFGRLVPGEFLVVLGAIDLAEFVEGLVAELHGFSVAGTVEAPRRRKRPRTAALTGPGWTTCDVLLPPEPPHVHRPRIYSHPIPIDMTKPAGLGRFRRLSVRDAVAIVKAMTRRSRSSRGNRPANRLWMYRKRMGFSQRQVAALIGYASAEHVGHWEHGRKLPSLVTALKLEIVYRVPVAYLFLEDYARLKTEIRAVLKIVPSLGIITSSSVSDHALPAKVICGARRARRMKLSDVLTMGATETATARSPGAASTIAFRAALS